MQYNKNVQITLWLAVIIISLIPTVVKLMSYPRYPGSDDAFIHLTVVENIATNNTWGINVDQNVNMSTSPLYTILLTSLYTSHTEMVSTGVMLSLLCSFIALMIMYMLLRYFSDNILIVMSGLLLGAFNIHLWRWNGTVMETTLGFMSIGGVFVTYYLWGRSNLDKWQSYFLFGFIIGVATLVRFELSILLICLGLQIIVDQRKIPLKNLLMMGVSFFIALAPWILFSFTIFDSILPTTFYAKTEDTIIFGMETLKGLIIVIGSGYAIAGLLSFIGLANIIRQQKSLSSFSPIISILLFPILLLIFYVLKSEIEGLESEARYYLPALYTIPIITVFLLDRAQFHTYKVFKVFLVLCIVGHIVLTLLLNQNRIAPVLQNFSDNYWMASEQVAEYLNANTVEGDTVLIYVDIGVISYKKADFYVADGGGLASPELQGLSLKEQIAVVQPQYLVYTLANEPGQVSQILGETGLELIWSTDGFLSHSVGTPDVIYYHHIYKITSP